MERNERREGRSRINFPLVVVVHENYGVRSWGIRKKPQFWMKVKKLSKIEGDVDFISKLKTVK